MLKRISFAVIAPPCLCLCITGWIAMTGFHGPKEIHSHDFFCISSNAIRRWRLSLILWNISKSNRWTGINGTDIHGPQSINHYTIVLLTFLTRHNDVLSVIGRAPIWIQRLTHFHHLIGQGKVPELRCWYSFTPYQLVCLIVWSTPPFNWQLPRPKLTKRANTGNRKQQVKV